MSGLRGVSGRPGEPVIKLSSRHVVKSSSPSSRRHWLFGEACKVGEVGSKSPCSKSPVLHVSKSPGLHVMSPGSPNITIFESVKSSALAILRSVQGLGSRLQVSMLSKSLRLQVPEFPRQGPPSQGGQFGQGGQGGQGGRPGRPA